MPSVRPRRLDRRTRRLREMRWRLVGLSQHLHELLSLLERRSPHLVGLGPQLDEMRPHLTKMLSWLAELRSLLERRSLHLDELSTLLDEMSAQLDQLQACLVPPFEPPAPPP